MQRKPPVATDWLPEVRRVARQRAFVSAAIAVIGDERVNFRIRYGQLFANVRFGEA